MKDLDKFRVYPTVDGGAVINGYIFQGTDYAFDGCHKFYLLSDKKEYEAAEKCGYNIYPINTLQAQFRNSCPLRFISLWNLEDPESTIVIQGEYGSSPYESEDDE